MRASATRSEVPSKSTVPQAADLIERRIENMTKWLSENCPDCANEQKHLDEGTRERAYWHYGYLVALRDVQKLLGLNCSVN